MQIGGVMFLVEPLLYPNRISFVCARDARSYY